MLNKTLEIMNSYKLVTEHPLLGPLMILDTVQVVKGNICSGDFRQKQQSIFK